jgi:hypothetical protein
MLLSSEHIFYRGQQVRGNLPLGHQAFSPRFHRCLYDGRLVVSTEQDHSQSRTTESNTVDQTADISVGERQVHDRQSRLESLRAFTQRPLVRHYHHRVERRSQKRPDALGEAVVRSRKDDGGRRRNHQARLTDASLVKNS